MFEALRAHHPGASLGRILWWRLLHLICFLWIAPCYRFRSWGAEHIPRTGPVLLVSNHQSLLDPILVGLPAYRRQFYALARSSLWKRWWLAWIIDSLNAIPVELDAAGARPDTRALRRCLEVLEQGQALLIFPEGTRSGDGTTQPFAPGVMLLIKRANPRMGPRPRIVPVAVEGAFAAWPRRRVLPYFRGRIGVTYGPAIEADELAALGPEAALARLRGQIESMRVDLARRLARAER